MAVILGGVIDGASRYGEALITSWHRKSINMTEYTQDQTYASIKDSEKLMYIAIICAITGVVKLILSSDLIGVIKYWYEYFYLKQMTKFDFTSPIREILDYQMREDFVLENRKCATSMSLTTSELEMTVSYVTQKYRGPYYYILHSKSIPNGRRYEQRRTIEGKIWPTFEYFPIYRNGCDILYINLYYYNGAIYGGLYSNNITIIEEFFKRIGIKRDFEKSKNNKYTFGKLVFDIPEFYQFDRYFIPEKQKIMDTLTSFKDKKLFGRAMKNNNLGFLLYGPAGTGKSVFAKVVANFLERSVYYIDFRKIKTIEELVNILTIKDTVFVLDEFDLLLKTFRKEENTDRHSELTSLRLHIALSAEHKKDEGRAAAAPSDSKNADSFLMEMMDSLTESALLSILDGSLDFTDRVIIASTNNIEEIPERFLRPGRFDMVIKLDNMRTKELEELLCYLYNIPNLPKGVKKQVVEKLDGKFSPSFITLLYSQHQDNIGELVDILVKRI